MPSSSPHPINTLIFEVFRLNGALAAAGDAITEPLGLTSARWQVLGAIGGSGGATVAELARRIGLTRQSVQRVVTELVGEGYVAMIDNPQHKRAKKAALTEQGQRSLDAITAAWTPIAQELSERFGPDLLMETARLLAELRDEFRSFASAADSTRANDTEGVIREDSK